MHRKRQRSLTCSWLSLISALFDPVKLGCSRRCPRHDARMVQGEELEICLPHFIPYSIPRRPSSAPQPGLACVDQSVQRMLAIQFALPCLPAPSMWPCPRRPGSVPGPRRREDSGGLWHPVESAAGPQSCSLVMLPGRCRLMRSLGIP